MIDQFTREYTDQRGRKWYSEMWVAENLGPEELSKLNSDSGLVSGLTHIMVDRVYAYPTSYKRSERSSSVNVKKRRDKLASTRSSMTPTATSSPIF